MMTIQEDREGTRILEKEEEEEEVVVYTVTADPTIVSTCLNSKNSIHFPH